MAYTRVNWEGGEKVSDGYVTIDGQNYTVVEATYSGTTPVDADNLNVMDEGIKNLDDEVSKKGVYELFSGNITTENSRINLSTPITNYDFLCVVTRGDAGSQTLIRLNPTLIPIALYNSGGTNYNIPAGKSSSIIIDIENPTTIKVSSGVTQYFAVMKIYGINL